MSAGVVERASKGGNGDEDDRRDRRDRRDRITSVKKTANRARVREYDRCPDVAAGDSHVNDTDEPGHGSSSPTL